MDNEKSQCDICGKWYLENELRKGNAANPTVICESCSNRDIEVSECSFYFQGLCQVSKSECDIDTKNQSCDGPMIV